MKRRGRVLLKMLAGAVAFFLIAALTAVFVARSDWFHDKVRERIVAEVEKATGGSVEIAAFKFDWRNLRAEVRDLVVRGAEPAGHPPLFRAESVAVGLKIVSAFRRDVNIALLAVNKPEISIEVDEEGNTNFPERAVAGRPDRDPVEPLLELAIERFSVTGGVLRYASKTVPFELSGENLEAHASYDAAVPGYRGRLTMKQTRAESPETLPVVFDTELAWTAEKDRVEFQRVRLRTEQSSVELTGAVEDLRSPAARFDVQAKLALAELATPLRLPVLPRGHVRLSGAVTLGEAGYSLRASVTANDLAIEQGRVRINGRRDRHHPVSPQDQGCGRDRAHAGDQDRDAGSPCRGGPHPASGDLDR